jgi:hypothetical protein
MPQRPSLERPAPRLAEQIQRPVWTGAVTPFGRWWARIVGAAPRALARRLSPHPRSSHDGIDLVTTEPRTAAHADAFFARTAEALAAAAARAPGSYAQLRKDMKSVILWAQPAPSPYHRFQLAALVPPDIALEADTESYAAWLLYTSGLGRGRESALDRAEEFIRALPPDERNHVRGALPADD